MSASNYPVTPPVQKQRTLAAAKPSRTSFSIPVIQLDESFESINELWWDSFWRRAKIAFADQLGCCHCSLDIKCQHQFRFNYGSNTVLDSLDGLIFSMCGHNRNVRCFAVIHDWSPKLDAVEIVVVTDPVTVEDACKKRASPGRYVPHSRYPHKDEEHIHDCVNRPELGVCWHNLCGPRFFIEWMLYFNEHPRHIHASYLPHLPLIQPPASNADSQSDSRPVFKLDSQKVSESGSQQLAIVRDDNGVARRFEGESMSMAYGNEDWGYFAPRLYCSCHLQRR